MTTQTIPRRSEIPEAYTWDATSIYPDDDAWEAEIASIGDALPAIARFQGQLDAPAALVECLDGYARIANRAMKVYTYATMFYSVDTGDQNAVAKNDRAQGVATRVFAALSFVEPSLVAIGFETLRRWMAEEPRLAVYAHYFDSLERLRAHVRSAEVEEVLGLAMDPLAAATETHTILADADLTFTHARDSSGAQFEIGQGTIDALIESADRDLRRTAWEAYADAHLALKNTIASCLSAGVKQDVFMARVRRFPSALDAALSNNHIPPTVFHALIETFRAQLPTWHRYWEVRRRALGLDRLHVYDVKAPISGNPPRVPMHQAMEWIAGGMAPLGREYVDVMRRGVLEQRWVDIYPNKGKRAGAFSSGAAGTHPFILTNYTDDLQSMSTLAHELGHSMHSYYTWQTQPPVYANYSIFVAEVASNFNQALVRAHLFETEHNAEFQIAVIEEAMYNFHRYFFIMPTLARFELEIHQRVERGEALTAEAMIGLMAQLFREGYGPNVVVDEERVGSTWMQFPTHLYANFYVYQYATGISAAHTLARGVLENAPGAVERYLQFLKAGSSDYPLDVLKQAGVDLTTPEPVEQTFAVLAGLVDRLERLVAQRAH